MFSALRNKDYRLYWFGLVISMTGGWVQTICHGWLVYQITDSKLLLGLVGFIGSAPLFCLTLFGGAIADRFNKKRILYVTQSLFCLTALTLGLLVQFHLVKIYHIIIISFLNGLLMAVDAPTRQSMPAFLVGKKDLSNAIALNSAAFNAARIVGPALAGLLVKYVSMSLCFFVNSASFLAVIAALAIMKVSTEPTYNGNGLSVLIDAKNGLRYIWNEPRIKTLILMAAVPSVFVMPYGMLMLIITRDNLGVGITGYSHVMSATGIGALAGALTLAKAANTKKRGKMLLSAAFAGSITLALAGHSKTVLLAELFMLGVGFSTVLYNATTNTLIQYIAPDEYRGRAMSGFVFVMLGLSPFASLQAGAAAEAFGAPTAMLFGAVLFGLTTIWVTVTQHRIREL